MRDPHPLTPSPTGRGGNKFHIIGAGGVGMSGLALLLKRMGADITASDKNDSPYLQKLAQKGIRTWVGSQPEKIPDGAHVFYSTAIKPDDPERRFAEANGFACEPRHALLKTITADYYTIAVAGCHGKTTTSGWIADLLTRAGLDPTALVGGTVPEWNSNYREGEGTLAGKKTLVIEADESDRSFLWIESSIALITNVDLDHTDVHASLETLEADFAAFAGTALKNGGGMLLSVECGGKLMDLLDAKAKASRESVVIRPERHTLLFHEHEYPVGLAGLHNLYNASLVLQLGKQLGLAEGAIRESLAVFGGVNRRMQVLEQFPEWSLDVIDDYAHHPHEVAATLTALAGRYERLLIFWEPHRLSRFTHFHEDFHTVLSEFSAKHSLFSLPLYAAGDREADYPAAIRLFERFKKTPFTHIPGRNMFSMQTLALDGQRAAAVFMGAGASSDYAQAFVEFMRRGK